MSAKVRDIRYWLKLVAHSLSICESGLCDPKDNRWLWIIGGMRVTPEHQAG